MLDLELDDHWLVVRLGTTHRVLSWAVHRPGLVEADAVAWLQVRNADLGPDTDPATLLADRLTKRELSNAVGMMTSCAVRNYERHAATVDDVRADCVVTLGLSNGCRLADLPAVRAWRPGTINMLLRLSIPLTEHALTEAISIAAEARTAALLAEDPHHGSSNPITGTGTDCIVIAAPLGAGSRYAGLHTAAGQALATAGYHATRAAAKAWFAQHATRPSEVVPMRDDAASG